MFFAKKSNFRTVSDSKNPAEYRRTCPVRLEAKNNITLNNATGLRISWTFASAGPVLCIHGESVWDAVLL